MYLKRKEKIENTVEYDPDQGEQIISRFITENMANQSFAMFWGRTDVYAKRGKNGGYFPQCDNRMMESVRNKGERRFVVKIVNIQNGQSLL